MNPEPSRPTPIIRQLLRGALECLISPLTPKSHPIKQNIIPLVTSGLMRYQNARRIVKVWSTRARGRRNHREKLHAFYRDFTRSDDAGRLARGDRSAGLGADDADFGQLAHRGSGRLAGP